jgi:acyl-coenzyme A synthetase/AMP-(fatty) acid ligase
VAFLTGEGIPGKKEILAELRKYLSGHKVPHEFLQVDALPRTANGKLRRKGLVELKAQGKKII